MYNKNVDETDTVVASMKYYGQDCEKKGGVAVWQNVGKNTDFVRTAARVCTCLTRLWNLSPCRFCGCIMISYNVIILYL